MDYKFFNKKLNDTDKEIFIFLLGIVNYKYFNEKDINDITIRHTGRTESINSLIEYFKEKYNIYLTIEKLEKMTVKILENVSDEYLLIFLRGGYIVENNRNGVRVILHYPKELRDRVIKIFEPYRSKKCSCYSVSTFHRKKAIYLLRELYDYGDCSVFIETDYDELAHLETIFELGD